MDNNDLIKQIEEASSEQGVKSNLTDIFEMFSGSKTPSPIASGITDRKDESYAFRGSYPDSLLSTYLNTVVSTKAIQALMSKEFVSYLLKLNPAIASHYLNAFSDMKKVPVLTHPKIMAAVKLLDAKNVDQGVFYNYISAVSVVTVPLKLIGNTFLGFVLTLADTVASSYFSAMTSAKHIDSLLDKRTLQACGLVKSMNAGVLYAYFNAIGTMKEGARLTDKNMIMFIAKTDPSVSTNYLNSLSSETIGLLTDDKFIKAMGTIRNVQQELGYGYVQAVTNTKDLARLSDKNFLDLLLKLDTAVASPYLGSIANNANGIAYLTDKRVMEFVTFFRNTDSEIMYSYFNAVAETKNIAALTDRNLGNALTELRKLAPISLNYYFASIGKTGNVDNFTGKDFLKAIGKGDVNDQILSAYVSSFTSSNNTDSLTDQRTLDSLLLLKGIDSGVMYGYFNAIGAVRYFEKLATKKFISAIGTVDKEMASTYLSVITNLKNAEHVTHDKVLQALNSLKGLGYTVIWNYLNAMTDASAVRSLTDSKVIEALRRVKDLENDAVWNYVNAIAFIGNVKKLTDSAFLDTMFKMDKSIIKNYLYALRVTKNMEVFTDSDLLDFAYKNPQGANWYFYGVGIQQSLNMLDNKELEKFTVRIFPDLFKGKK